MNAVTKGKTLVILDDRSREIFSLVNRGGGRYRILPPKGKGLRFSGDVVNARGCMSYEPGTSIAISTLDKIAVEVCAPEDLGVRESPPINNPKPR